MHLRTPQLPEIDGSQGAFIGVVVTLSVLIVVCCVAVFYLLRHHEPTEQDRAARRELYRRAREHTHAHPVTSSNPSAFGGGVTRSLGTKAKSWWQSVGGGGGRRGGRGWIRAGSDDEWATHSVHEGDDSELGGDRPRSLSVLDQPTRDITRRGADSEGGGGVRVVESPLSDAASGFIHAAYAYADAYTYTDPFSKTTAVQRSQSPPLSSPASSPASIDDSDSHHEAAHDSGEDHRHRSTMSNSSVWTHAGSKFVEDI